mgnify:CR=1 FL=1
MTAQNNPEDEDGKPRFHGWRDWPLMPAPNSRRARKANTQSQTPSKPIGSPKSLEPPPVQSIKSLNIPETESGWNARAVRLVRTYVQEVGWKYAVEFGVVSLTLGVAAAGGTAYVYWDRIFSLAPVQIEASEEAPQDGWDAEVFRAN